MLSQELKKETLKMKMEMKLKNKYGYFKNALIEI